MDSQTDCGTRESGTKTLKVSETKARFLMVSMPKYEAALCTLVTFCAKPKKALFTNWRTLADMAISCSRMPATSAIEAFGLVTVWVSELYVLEREGSSPIVPMTSRI